jgi:hypothetical protein
MIQHRVVVGPDEIVHQGRHHHVAATCRCASLRPSVVLLKFTTSEDRQVAL